MPHRFMSRAGLSDQVHGQESRTLLKVKAQPVKAVARWKMRRAGSPPRLNISRHDSEHDHAMYVRIAHHLEMLYGVFNIQRLIVIELSCRCL